MRLPFAGFALVSLLCAACAGAGSVEGTIHGRTFEVVEAASITASDDYGDTAGMIALSSKPGLCDTLGSDAILKDAQVMFIQVEVYNVSRRVFAAPQGAGDYNVVVPDTDAEGAMAVVRYDRTNAQCQFPEGDVVGTRGTLSISAVGDDGAYEGSGDLVLDTGDSIKLEFSGTPCSALAGFALGEFQPTGCK